MSCLCLQKEQKRIAYTHDTVPDLEGNPKGTRRGTTWLLAVASHVHVSHAQAVGVIEPRR